MTHEEPGLFDLPETAPTSSVIEDIPISPEQITTLRSAFATAGISSMAERQELIQSCVIRRISNIRELYSRDVRQVLARIEGRGRRSEATSGSAWDNREEDTWIDKL